MTTDHMRAFLFQEQVLARTSTRTTPLPWGTAYFNDDFPLRYDANMAIVGRPLGGATAEDIARALDDAYEGFRHREVEFASAVDADAIALGMAEHGYSVEGLVVMVLRRGSDRESDLAATEELTFDDYRPLSLEIHARQPWSSDPFTLGGRVPSAREHDRRQQPAGGTGQSHQTPELCYIADRRGRQGRQKGTRRGKRRL